MPGAWEIPSIFQFSFIFAIGNHEVQQEEKCLPSPYPANVPRSIFLPLVPKCGEIMPVRFATNIIPWLTEQRSAGMMEFPAHSQAALPLGSAHLACGHAPLNQDKRAREERAWNERAGISWVSQANTAPPSAKHTRDGAVRGVVWFVLLLRCIDMQLRWK